MTSNGRVDGELAGRVAVVTGGGSGIGRGAAQELARHGAAVLVGDVNAETAKRTADTIVARGGRATAMTVDVVDSSSCDAFAAKALEWGGRVDTLFNAAGIQFQEHRLEHEQCRTG